MVKTFGNEKIIVITINMPKDVVAQGPSGSRRIKNSEGYFFPSAMLMLRGKARKTWSFPEQANCTGVMVMSENGR